MKKKIYLICKILFFIGLMSSAYSQKLGYLAVVGNVKKNNSGLDGAEIKVAKSSGGTQTYATMSGGKFTFNLELDNEYTIKISKPGCITKIVSVSTKIPEKEKEFAYSFKFNLELFDKVEGVENTDILDKPVAKITFNETYLDFDYDAQYTKAIQSQIEDLKKSMEALAEAERLKKEVEEKARLESEARAKAETERLKQEAEAKARLEVEAKAKAEAERLKKEAEEKARLESEARARAETERLKQEAEAKARLEVEAKAKAEAERLRKEAEEKARLESEARAETERLRQEGEAKARLEAEAKAKAEAERLKKEAEEKARLESEARARAETERLKQEGEAKARLEAEKRNRLLEAEARAKAEKERLQKETEARARLQAETKKYPDGINEENIVESNRTIKKTIVRVDGDENIYQKIIYNWGGVFYFKNDISISNTIYDLELKNSKSRINP